MSAKTYNQCVDRCEDTYADGVPLDICLDQCDEQFAAGREPGGNVLELLPTPGAEEPK